MFFRTKPQTCKLLRKQYMDVAENPAVRPCGNMSPKMCPSYGTRRDGLLCLLRYDHKVDCLKGVIPTNRQILGVPLNKLLYRKRNLFLFPNTIYFYTADTVDSFTATAVSCVGFIMCLGMAAPSTLVISPIPHSLSVKLICSLSFITALLMSMNIIQDARITGQWSNKEVSGVSTLHRMSVPREHVICFLIIY